MAKDKTIKTELDDFVANLIKIEEQNDKIIEQAQKTDVFFIRSKSGIGIKQTPDYFKKQAGGIIDAFVNDGVGTAQFASQVSTHVVKNNGGNFHLQEQGSTPIIIDSKTASNLFTSFYESVRQSRIKNATEKQESKKSPIEGAKFSSNIKRSSNYQESYANEDKKRSKNI